jgi:hypothetical protein
MLKNNLSLARFARAAEVTEFLCLVQIPGETLVSGQTTGAFGAVETFFSYPQGELFEQNSDFSNSAQ